MATMQIATLVLLAVAACSAAPNRIIGGSPVLIDEYPSIVQVDYKVMFSENFARSCSANILNNLYVLSAAHCFHGWMYRPHWRRIRAGATMSDIGGYVHYIVEAFNYPGYHTFSLNHDITVVLLQTPLTFTPVVQPGAIIAQGFDLPDNTPVTYAGWGAILEIGVQSDELRHVGVYTVNWEECRQRYADLEEVDPKLVPRIVTENMVCAGLLDVGGKDACQGDSGGPLYYDNNGLQLLIGVISWGEGCANATYPGVTARVASYTDWIVATAV